MTFHISPRRRLQSARRRAASAERRRRKMRRVKGVFSGKGHFLFLRAREKCARVCVYSLHKNDDCFSFLSCYELQKYYVLVQNTKRRCLSLSYSSQLLFSRSCFSFSRLCFCFFCCLDKSSVFFVRWFWAPFFEQVVFAVRVFVVTSESDVLPVVKRHFRLFD